MKRRFLNSSINFIKKYKNVSEEEIEYIIYGLEGIYLTITKAIIIFGCAIIFGIFKEVLYLLIFYNIIRSQAFGLHASNSLYCLISSFILFIGGAYFCKYVTLPLWLMIVISCICIICLFLYAPADTEKRPIVNPKKRKRFKFLSCFLGIILFILIIIYKNNYMLLGMVYSVIMILPITYKIFNMPYDNYKRYGIN